MSKPVARIVIFVPWLPQPIFKSYDTMAEYAADRDIIIGGRGLITIRVGRGQDHEYEEFISAGAVAHFRLEVFG